MKWSRHGVVAASVAAAVWLQWGAGALAQEQPAGSGSPDGRRTLEEMIDVRSKGNDDAEAAQDRVDAISDETQELLAKYRTTLKQIDSITLYNKQMRDLIAAQQKELVSLQDQLDRVEIVGRSVTPLMLKMIERVGEFVELDVPFLLEERRKRVEDLREMMGRADVTTAEKFRQIMEVYEIENEYGRTIEAYRAPIKTEGRERTVNFLRFGRIALVYQSRDESEAGVWDQKTRSWVPLDSSYRSAIREGLRIARKQAAPDLINLPLPAPRDAREES